VDVNDLPYVHTYIHATSDPELSRKKKTISQIWTGSKKNKESEKKDRQRKKHLIPPLDKHIVRPEPLRARRLLERRAEARLVRQQPRLRDHDAVVDAEALVCRIHAAAAVARHRAHHLLQPLVAPDPADDQHLLGPDVRHGALRDLDQHREHRLLQREAQVGPREARVAVFVCLRELLVTLRPVQTVGRGDGLDRREDAREGAVHALDRVGQLDEPLALLGQLLDVVPRGGVVGDVQRAREAVQAVADGDVERLAEDAVPLGAVGDDLGVAAGDVEDDGVRSAGDVTAHFDVCAFVSFY